MASSIDAYFAGKTEQDIGRDYASRVKRNLLLSIRSKTSKGATGMALKSTAKPVFKHGLLERITLFTPYYIYPILDYGFEGTKVNGVKMRLQAGKFLADALENGKVIQDLADVIGNQRADAILFRTNFGFDKEFNTSNSLGNE